MAPSGGRWRSISPGCWIPATAPITSAAGIARKNTAAGLLVHKATHHFDLVNWWIDSYPRQVFALGDLLFYGAANAEARGEHYSYTARYTGEAAAKTTRLPCAWTRRKPTPGSIWRPKSETGYIRDRNVFGEPITAEDTMTVTARYANGVLLSYCLVAYAPWEGLRIAVTGTTRTPGDGRYRDREPSQAG